MIVPDLPDEDGAAEQPTLVAAGAPQPPEPDPLPAVGSCLHLSCRRGQPGPLVLPLKIASIALDLRDIPLLARYLPHIVFHVSSM